MAKVHGEFFQRTEMGTVYAPDEATASSKAEDYIQAQYGNVNIDIDIGMCIR